MISNLLSNLDWLAVLVATVAYFIIGAAWYGVLGKGWMEAAGLSRDQINNNFNKAVYGVTFIIEFVIVAFMGGLMGQDLGTGDAVQFGLIVGLIFSGLTTWIHYLYTMRSKNLIFYDAGYTTIASIVAAVIYASM